MRRLFAQSCVARIVATALVACALPARQARADLAPGEHQAILFGTLSPGTSLGAIAGEVPTARHPRGTVLIAWSLLSLGATLTEWDLARSRIVRQGSLGWPEGNVGLARAGSWLAVAGDGLTAQGRHVLWALVDESTLRVVRQVDLGAGVTPDVATDGSLSAVVWNASAPVREGSGSSWCVAIVDVDGRVLGVWHAPVAPVTSARARVALLDGQAYVALPGEPPCALVALAPNGSVVREISLASASCGGPIAAVGARLLVGAERQIEFLSPDLALVTRQPSESAMRLFSVGPDGRAVTCDGEVLSSGFILGARLRGLAWGSCLAALWSAETPVAIATSSKAGDVAWVDWLEPAAARGH